MRAAGARTAAQASGPASQMSAPRPVYKQIGACHRARGVREHVGPGRRGRPGRGRQALGQLEHPRTEVEPDDLIGAEIPERQRVAPAGALEMDRTTTFP